MIQIKVFGDVWRTCSDAKSILEKCGVAIVAKGLDGNGVLEEGAMRRFRHICG
jgi:hypothetical protein